MLGLDRLANGFQFALDSARLIDARLLLLQFLLCLGSQGLQFDQFKLLLLNCGKHACGLIVEALYFRITFFDILHAFFSVLVKPYRFQGGVVKG